MAKKKDLPAMPFYFGDWRKAPEIRALDLDVRMIWFEIIGYMWESTERGYLTLNGKPVITPVISKMVGVDITEMEKALHQMEQFNVYSKREDGAIYCRKMIRDEELRQLKAKAGRKGMKKRYGKKSVITPVITKPEIETVIENKNIPTLIDFLDYSKILCKKANIDYSEVKFSIEQKYETWVQDGWIDGNKNKIKIWKTKLGAVLPHLKAIKKQYKERTGGVKN